MRERETRPDFRAPVAELRRHLAAGEGYAAIGRRYGVDEGAVRYRCQKLGLRDRVRGERPPEAALRIALSHSDVPLKAIARAFGCEAATVTRAARAYGIPTDQAGRAMLGASR